LGHNETAEVFSHQILSKINDENPWKNEEQ
jgi:hypothetical protein